MGAASDPLSHLFLMFCLLVGGRVLLSDHEVELFNSIYSFLFGVSGSQATKCKYECEQTGGCTAKYFGPPRSGNTIVSLPNLLVNLKTTELSNTKIRKFPNKLKLDLRIHPSARVPASPTSLVEAAVELPRSAWTATRRSSVRGTQALAPEELF